MNLKILKISAVVVHDVSTHILNCVNREPFEALITHSTYEFLKAVGTRVADARHRVSKPKENKRARQRKDPSLGLLFWPSVSLRFEP